MLSMPQTPQPVRPASERRRAFIAAKACSLICSRTSALCRCTRASRSWICALPLTMPSVSEKPTANASRSSGVAIITACEMPLYTRATGSSSATLSVAGCAAPSLCRTMLRAS